MWQNNGWNHIIGLTHVNITLVYLFNANKAKKQKTIITQ